MKTIEIYADTRGVSRCTSPRCGQKILWATTVKGGKKMCFDDLELVPFSTYHDESRRLIEVVDLAANHWATCPDRARFSNRERGTSAERKIEPSVHQCYVSYCARLVPKTYLMCPAHWAKVSPATMREVWKWFREKQANGSDVAIQNHYAAIEKARTEVETKESGPLLANHD